MESTTLILISIPILVIAVLILERIFRVEIRHRLHDMREGRIGQMVWSEIVYEGRSRNDAPRRRFSEADVSGLTSLSDALRATGWWPHSNRGLVSYVWLRQPDGSVHLYVGVSRAHYGDGSVVRIAASSLGATAQRMETHPNIPTEAIATALRGGIRLGSVKNQSESHGSLVNAVSTALSNLPVGATASVVITAEPVYRGEQRRLNGDIVEYQSIQVGTGAKFSAADAASTMSSRAIRASVFATTSTPDQSLPAQLISAALPGVPSLGWESSAKIMSVEKANPKFLKRLAQGEVILSPFIWLNPRWYFQGVFRRNFRTEQGTGQSVGAISAPPSGKDIFYLHPMALYEAVSFPENMALAGVDVHKDQTPSRGIPQSMIPVHDQIFMGRSGTDQFIDLDLDDLNFPIFTAGAPGSGKTNFLQTILAGVVKHCIERTRGLQITPVWGETKGEGMIDAWNICRVHPRAVLIDTHNPEATHRLALEGPRLSDGASVTDILRNVTNLVSGFQFAWGQAVADRSRMLLDFAIRISMLLSEEDIRFLQMDHIVDARRPNVIELAWYILGGDIQVQPGPRLLTLHEDYRTKGEHLTDQRVEHLTASISKISQFLNPATSKNLREMLIAPQGKLSDLTKVPGAWTPDHRIDFYVPQVPAHFAPIVINMGPYRLADGVNFASIPTTLSKKLLMITNYLLWDTIKSNCSGWGAAGKRVNVFFDELADVATSSESEDIVNVVADANKEGRSRGTALFVGCQSPSQLPALAKHSVLSSRTKFFFGMQESNDLREASRDLASGNDREMPYSQDDIRRLPSGTCAGVMQRGNELLPPFTLKVPYAPKWAEFLLRPNVSVNDALVDYYEWADQNLVQSSNIKEAKTWERDEPSWDDPISYATFSDPY